MTQQMTQGLRMRAAWGALVVGFFAALLLSHSVFGYQWFTYAEPLKQVVLALGVSVAWGFAVLTRPASSMPSLWWLAIPFAATLPGALLTGGRWTYHGYSEVINTALALTWCVLWFYAWRDRLQAARMAARVLAVGAALTVLWAGVQWGVAGFSGAPPTHFGNQNYASNFVILTAPFMFYWAYVAQGRTRWLWLTLGVLSALALLFVFQTLATILAFAIAAYLMAGVWLRVRQASRTAWWLWLTPIALFVVAVTLLNLYYWQLAAEFRYLQLAGPHAWYPRTYPWMVGWLAVLDAPWFGHGPGSSWSLFNAFQAGVPEVFAVATSTDYQHIHNDYLEWLQEGGALGLVAYLALWAWILWRGVRVVVDSLRETTERALAAAAVFGLIAYHFHALVEVSARMPVNRLALFVTGAIVLGLTLKPRLSLSEGSRWRYAASGLLLGVSAWALSIEIPRQHATFVAMNAPALMNNDAQWRYKIEQSDSVEAMYLRVTQKLYQFRDPSGTNELLDRVERRIPSFRETEFLRFYAYVYENQGKPADLAKIKSLLENARNHSRYLPIVEHFSAQFAAHSGDHELFLEVLEDRLYRASIAYQVGLADRRAAVRVRVDPNGDGFAMIYGEGGKLTFLMGMPQLKLLMEIASEKLTREAATVAIQQIPAKIRAAKEPVPGFKGRLDALARDYILGFPVLSEPPFK
jgi:O-antigen ligase